MFKPIIQKIEQRIVAGLDATGPPSFLSPEWFLTGISAAYGRIIELRMLLYRTKICRSKRLPCPVLSIGNIVAGGTGKTPLAIYIAGLLVKMGKRPAVVSRGYKGRFTGPGRIVSDGSRIFSTAEECGDEPFMMAQRESFPVVVGKKRFDAGSMAVKELGCKAIVLDDGFQHSALERDMDLVLLDWERPFGNGRLLPAGRLREPVQTAIKRADAIIFTRCPEGADPLKTHPDLIDRGGRCPYFTTRHLPFVLNLYPKSNRLSPGRGETAYSPTVLADLGDKRAVLFSGLAKNQSFYRSMKAVGVKIVSHLEFSDHYRYKEADIKKVNQAAADQDADLIITTEKDWSKLGRIKRWQADLAVIGIDIVFDDPQGFQAFLETRFQ